MPWSTEQHRAAAVTPAICMGRNQAAAPHVPFTRVTILANVCVYCLQPIHRETEPGNAWTTQFIITEDDDLWT